MKPVNYKGCQIIRTGSFTTVWLTDASLRRREVYRPLYAVRGSVTKAEGVRPFLTSLADAKRFITEAFEARRYSFTEEAE